MTTIHRIEVPVPYAVKWVNCYYIEDSTPTLIDTGINLPECFDALAQGIRDAKGDIAGLARVITTHGHMDHSGLAGKIEEVSGAEVFVHASDRDKISNDDAYLNARMDAFGNFLSEAGVPESSVEEVVDQLWEMFKNLTGPVGALNALSGGEVFGFDDFELTVVPTPGHSPGSICLFDEKQGILFSGDCVLEEVIADPMSDIKSLIAHQASLEKIATLPVKKVLPGHGAAFTEHQRRIRRILGRHDRRSKQILKILERSGNGSSKTPFNIALELFSFSNVLDVLYCVSSVLAHLELLEARGEIDYFAGTASN